MRLPFLRLPTELRLEIYRLILIGRTIHIEEIDKRGQESSSTPNPVSCPTAYAPQMTRCSRSLTRSVRNTLQIHRPPQFVAPRNRVSVTSNLTELGAMGRFASRSSSFASAARLMTIDGAALLPYAENYFIISVFGHTGFREAFAVRFSLEKHRHAHCGRVEKLGGRD